jgi:hypothetical protein
MMPRATIIVVAVNGGKNPDMNSEMNLLWGRFQNPFWSG